MMKMKNTMKVTGALVMASPLLRAEGPFMITGSDLTLGAQAKNVFWQVGSAATINAAGNGSMVGTIIASAGINFSTAGNGKVTVHATGAAAVTITHTGDEDYTYPAL